MNQPFRQHVFEERQPGDSNIAIFVGAVVLSFLIHIALAYYGDKWKIDFGSSAAVVEKPRSLDIPVEISEVEQTMDLTEIFEAPPEESKSEELVDPQSQQGDGPIAPPSMSDAVEEISNAVYAPPDDFTDADSKLEWAPREEILDIASHVVENVESPYSRIDLKPIERMIEVPDIAPGTLPVKPVFEEDNVSNVYIPPAPVVVPAAVAEVAPPTVAVDVEESAPAIDVESTIVEPPPLEPEPEPIEESLTASVRAFRPARSDGYTYFEISVVRKDAQILPAIPRDILVAIDASASISDERLYQCKEAVRKFLAGAFNPGDRFNLLAFNTDNSWAFPGGWAAPTVQNIAAASKFIESVRSAGNTDIYNAMDGVLRELSNDPRRSTIVLLVSDGVATAGQFRRDSEIIGGFSDRNNGKVSVFSLGVKKASDDYLLSMISYANRGGNAGIARDRFGIPSMFDGLFKSIGTPVLTDVRFTFNNAAGATMAPVHTENLYHDRPLKIFGRVPESVREVMFQARGFNGDKPHDMLFALDLGEAAPGAGDPEIATGWARARIYDLIVEAAKNGEEAVLPEMREISMRHGVRIPFTVNR